MTNWGAIMLASGALAGAVLVSSVAEPIGAVVAGGFLGSYTTFSTALVQTAELTARSEHQRAAANLVATIGLTTAGALAGLLLVTAWA